MQEDIHAFGCVTNLGKLISPGLFAKLDSAVGFLSSMLLTQHLYMTDVDFFFLLVKIFLLFKCPPSSQKNAFSKDRTKHKTLL